MRDAQAKGRYRTKLDAHNVRIILKRIHAGEEQAIIAADYGVARSIIGSIARNKAWRHIKREFRVINYKSRAAVGERNSNAKLTAKQIAQMKRDIASGKVSNYVALGYKYGVSRQHARRVVTGLMWKHMGTAQ